MRRISFALTKDAFLDGSKTVTRRKGWASLKPGDRLLAVSKCMGLKPGETADVYGPIEVVSVRRERLCDIVNCSTFHHDAPTVRNVECRREGFPDMTGSEFIRFFRKHMGGPRNQIVTRIEFRRVEPRALDSVKLSPAMRETLRRVEGSIVGGYRGTHYSNAGTMQALVRRGLARRLGRGDGGPVWALTRLGRQVARELVEEAHHGN